MKKKVDKRINKALSNEIKKHLKLLPKTKATSFDIACICGCSSSYVRTIACRLGVSFNTGKVRSIGEYAIKHGVTKCCAKFRCSRNIAYVYKSKIKALKGTK